MPWKECHVEDERLRFVARLLDGEKMARLCAEFGISRKTGYKIYDRYQEIGLTGLTDRSRRPYRHANQLPMVIEKTIVRLKREYPSWVPPRSASACGNAARTSSVPPPARSMRCSIGMGW
jgi:putative transposase